MTRVMVVWEDTYYQPLAKLLDRAVRRRSDGTDPTPLSWPTVLHHTARSNNAFDRYVETTWPKASARGLPMSPGPIDHVICVVDGDKLSELMPRDIPRPPSDPAKVAPWHATAEQAWHDRLRGKSSPSGPPASSIHGLVLRWSKESILLAGYDQPAFAHHLDCDAALPEVQRVVKECNPRPDRIAAAEFSHNYRSPMSCLKTLRRAVNLDDLAKNAPQIDDALLKLGRDSLDVLCARAPDLHRLAERIWQLRV